MDKKTKKIDLYGELREGLEEMVPVEKGQRELTRTHHFFAKDDTGMSSRNLMRRI